MIEIPDALWSQLLNSFALQTPHLERIAYLDGHRLPNGRGIVTTVTIPDAECHPGWYTVPSGKMSEAGQHLRSRGMMRLAQVHTHGNAETRHSPRDDRLAYSQLDGALSIVLPFHANHRPRPFDAAVHIREPNGWRLLSMDEVDDVIDVVPAVLDFRRETWRPSRPVTKVISMVNCLRSIARRVWWSRSRSSRL